MHPKAPNKYSVNTVIKYYEHMIQSSHFDLTSVSANSILTVLKSTQISKATALDRLSGRFLKNGVKFLAKAITDLCNLSINSENFPDLWKLKPIHKKGSLTQPCNYTPISLLSFCYLKKVIPDQTSTFLNSKNLWYTYQSGFPR